MKIHFKCSQNFVEFGLSSEITYVNSVLHPSGIAKSSTGFGWDKGRKVISVGWQVTNTV